jgi:hypothetical protein
LDRLLHRSDDSALPPAAAPPTPLADLSRAVRDAAVDTRRQRSQAGPRRPVRAIDVLLDELERFNLAGGAITASPPVLTWLAQVEVAVGLPVPGWVLAVPDTVRLHAAMLRWQGALLSQCRPDRDDIGDLRDDPLDLLLLSSAPPPEGLLHRRQRVRRQVA